MGRKVMMPDRTELEWTYKPADLFEEAYRYTDAEYNLVVENGRVVATLTTPQEPVDAGLEERVWERVDSILRVKELQTSRISTLVGPRLYQYEGGRRRENHRLKVAMTAVSFTGGAVDFILRDPDGNILRDSRAERITAEHSQLDSIAPKLARSPILRGMVESYIKSISDPGNALVHLYEVRDALRKEYGTIGAARTTLSICRNEWERFDVLANEEPLEQGRHRGKHIGTGSLRPACSTELEEARSIVKRWIIAFADKV